MTKVLLICIKEKYCNFLKTEMKNYIGGNYDDILNISSHTETKTLTKISVAVIWKSICYITLHLPSQ